jgi:hypothetical protein
VFNSTTNLVKNIYKFTEKGGNLHLFLMLLEVAFSHPFGLIVMFYQDLESARKPEGGPGLVECWELGVVREIWGTPTTYWRLALREIDSERCPFESLSTTTSFFGDYCYLRLDPTHPIAFTVSRCPSLLARFEQNMPISSMEH